MGDPRVHDVSLRVGVMRLNEAERQLRALSGNVSKPGVGGGFYWSAGLGHGLCPPGCVGLDRRVPLWVLVC